MRIIQLPEAQGVNADDVFVININGVDYQVPAALLAAAMATVGDYLTSDNLPLPVGSGGTGATSAAAARTALAITPVNIGALPSANVYNALDQAGAGYALDARQGKALDEAKQDKLTFDTEPTEDSTNPVTSGGVYNAIQQSTATLNSKIKSGTMSITANANGYGYTVVNHAFGNTDYSCILSIEYGNNFTNATPAYRYKQNNSIGIGFYNSGNSDLTLNIDYILCKN